MSCCSGIPEAGGTPNHPLLQDTVTLSRVMEWPVVVSPKGTVPRQNAETLLQMQGCTLPTGCVKPCPLPCHASLPWIMTTSGSSPPARSKMIYAGTLTALPVTSPGAGEPIGILTRVDTPLSSGAQTLLSAIRKSMPA